MIKYDVRLANLDQHLFEVRCQISDPGKEQLFSMPSWIPGSYVLREFARHVVSISAENEQGPVEIKKLSKSIWECKNSGSLLTVAIKVFAFDLSVRGAFLDGERGFFNGTCLFLSPKGKEKDPVIVRLQRPEDSRCKNWQVATAMNTVEVDDAGFGTYRATDYAELIDHPVEISKYSDIFLLLLRLPIVWLSLVVIAQNPRELLKI